MRRSWAMLLWLTCLPATAAEVVFYRCTDASGALTVQNMPCPKGMQQRTRVMQAVAAPTPALAPPATTTNTTAPAASDPAATVPAATMERLYAAPQAAAPIPAKPAPITLPPLFECKQRDGATYMSETAEPEAHCVTMQVTGLDGNPRTAAGDACEVFRDSCTAVEPEQHCASWQRRIADARTASQLTSLAQAPARRQEYERLKALLDASDCAAQKP